jgi:hypothetical protein
MRLQIAKEGQLVTRILQIAVGLVSWGTAIAASLSITNLPGDWGHGVCGAWGCGPPLQPLIACHLTWFVVLAPMAWLLTQGPLRKYQRVVGVLAVSVAGAAILGIVLHQWLRWLPNVSAWQRPYFLQRCAFVVVTAIDFPILQFLLLGSWLALVHPCRTRAQAPIRRQDASTADAAQGPAAY